MRDLKNKLTSGKNTKNTQGRKGKMFGYQVLGFGSGGVPFVGMTATGGTITTVGDFKVHTFTGPGTFEVTEASNDPDANSVQYLIVGGGGGMGYGYGGAGGAGGYRAAGCGPAPLQASNAPTPVTSYPIVIGAAGAGGPVRPVGPYAPASNGGNSSAISLTGAGGGYGGSTPSSAPGGPGGSGGGAGGPASHGSAIAGGTGNTPPVSPPQGNNGESGPAPEGNQGGGAGAAGSSPRTNVTGVTNSIDGTPKKYACGGRSGSGSPDNMVPRANSGFGGKCQGVAGCTGIVIIKYRIA
jgi:hypothetical protein